MTNIVDIEITGDQHSGKTKLAVLVSRFLEAAGISVVLQKADPEIEEKLGKPQEELLSELAAKGIQVRIREMRT